MDVIVGLYQGSKSWEKAEKVGLTVVTAAEAAKAADIILMLVNDEKRANLYKESIEPNKGNCTCLCTWNWRRKMEQIFPMHTTIFQIKPALLIM